MLEINVCWTGKCRSVQPVEVAGLHCPKDENGKFINIVDMSRVKWVIILLQLQTILYLNVYYLVNTNSIFISVFYLLYISLYMFRTPIFQRAVS